MTAQELSKSSSTLPSCAGDDRNISKIFVGGRERVVWKLQEFADE